MRTSFLLMTAILSMLFAGSALAADAFRVSAHVFHLGEVIAQPVLEVEEGVTAAASSEPGSWGQYRFVALVRPAADGQVYVSVQFSSGDIDIQPNLLVDIGKPASVTIKKVRMDLLVETIGHAAPTDPAQPASLIQDRVEGNIR